MQRSGLEPDTLTYKANLAWPWNSLMACSGVAWNPSRSHMMRPIWACEVGKLLHWAFELLMTCKGKGRSITRESDIYSER